MTEHAPAPGYPVSAPGGDQANAVATAAMTHVHHALPALNEMFHAVGNQPAAGSQLARDVDDATVYMAHNMAGVLFMSAEDHLRFVLNVMVKEVPLPIYALYTVARGGLEAAAWACWLEDPSLSANQRAGRALTERLYSLHQSKRLGAAPEFDKRMEEVLGVAQGMHLTPIRRGRDDPTPVGFGERRPFVTDLIANLLPEPGQSTAGISVGEFAYRALSGRAHGVAYALIHGGTIVGKVNQHTSMAFVELDIPLFLQLFKPALDLHVLSVRYRLEVGGKDPKQLDTLLESLPAYGPGLGG